MQQVGKRGGDAKVATPAAHSPEEIRMLGRTCREALALGRDDVDGQQVVAGRAIEAHKPAIAAPQREAGNADIRLGPTAGRQPKGLRLSVQFPPADSGLRDRRARLRVYTDALQARKVYH